MSNFATDFWKRLALAEVFSASQLEVDTPRKASERTLDNLELSKKKSLSSIRATTNTLTYGATYSDLEVYNKNRFEQQEGGDRIALKFAPARNQRFASQYSNSKTGEDDWLVIGTGNRNEFNRLQTAIKGALNKTGSYSYNGKKYNDINVLYLNEGLLFSNTGFRSHTRKALRQLDKTSRTMMSQLDGDSLENTFLNRSFAVRQTKGINNWIGDGLRIVDTTQENTFNGSRYSVAQVLSSKGIFLGNYEEELDDFADNVPGAFRRMESLLISYKNSKVPKAITNIFKKEAADFKKAEKAPIFVGYKETQLGYDWLTGLPAKAQRNDLTAKRLTNFAGANSPFFQQDQVYIALEHVDIVTGAGKDLVILADDLNNRSQRVVPRIHDFRRGQDKALIPIDVFPGFKMTKNGKLPKSSFVSGKRATNKNHRLIYDSSSGFLYHDRDGAGGATQQLIASFTNKPSLTAGDFLLG
jgi:hypothetical protein